MRALMIGAAVIALMGCQTPEQRAKAAYTEALNWCDGAIAQRETPDTRLNPTDRGALMRQCAREIVAMEQVEQSNNLAAASVLLGYGAGMTALSQPVPQAAPSIGLNCTTVPLPNGGATTRCF